MVEINFYAPIIAVVLILILFHLIPESVRLRRFLSENGFIRCNEENMFIKEKTEITEQRKTSGNSNIFKPHKIMVNDSEIFCFSRSNIFVHLISVLLPKEFLFPFKRKSNLPLIIYLKQIPAKDIWIPFMTSFPKSLFGKHKGDLISIDMPIEFRNGKIIAAFGPKGSTLYDLIDKDVLSMIEHCGEHDIYIFQACGNYALVSSVMGFRIDINKTWEIVKQFACR